MGPLASTPSKDQRPKPGQAANLRRRAATRAAARVCGPLRGSYWPAGGQRCWRGGRARAARGGAQASRISGAPYRTVIIGTNVIYDSQFPLASSRFGRDSIQYRVGKTHCQGHQDPSKRVPIFLGGTEALIKMVPIGSVPIPR